MWSFYSEAICCLDQPGAILRVFLHAITVQRLLDCFPWKSTRRNLFLLMMFFARSPRSQKIL